MTKEEMISVIEAAGIVGMGGAGFPTNVKLSPKEPVLKRMRWIIPIWVLQLHPS